jgi:hypothetical protein
MVLGLGVHPNLDAGYRIEGLTPPDMRKFLSYGGFSPADLPVEKEQ